MMDERLEQRVQEQGSGHKRTVLIDNGAYSSSGNYMQNIAYRRQHPHTLDLDDPSVTYYSTNSFGDYSQNAAYDDDASDNEDDTADTTYHSSHHSREEDSGRKQTVFNKKGAYSSSSNYMQNIAYNRSCAHTSDPDDPSVTYYSTNSNSFGEYSRNVAHDNTPDIEDDTASTTYHSSHHSTNYSKNIAYKHNSGGGDDEDTTYYYANYAYVARSHGPYEANVAYNIHSEGQVEEDGEKDYDDRPATFEDKPRNGFTGDEESS